MSASSPSTKHMQLLCLTMSTGQLANGIEQMRCRAMRFARGYGKFVSSGDSPSSHITYYMLQVEILYHLQPQSIIGVETSPAGLGSFRQIQNNQLQLARHHLNYRMRYYPSFVQSILNIL